MHGRTFSRVPPTGPYSPNSFQSEGTWPHADIGCSALACVALPSGHISAASAVAGDGVGLSFAPGAPAAVGLAPERLNLSAGGFLPWMIFTIRNIHTSSKSLYDCKWGVFEELCSREGHIFFECSVGVILSFLQDLIDKQRVFSTIKVYLVVIAACHVGFEGRTTS